MYCDMRTIGPTEGSSETARRPVAVQSSMSDIPVRAWAVSVYVSDSSHESLR